MVRVRGFLRWLQQGVGFVNGLDTASRARARALSLFLSLYAHTMSPHSHPSIGRTRRKACVTTLSLTCVSVSPPCVPRPSVTGAMFERPGKLSDYIKSPYVVIFFSFLSLLDAWRLRRYYVYLSCIYRYRYTCVGTWRMDPSIGI
jgi:hypothetical protein